MAWKKGPKPFSLQEAALNSGFKRTDNTDILIVIIWRYHFHQKCSCPQGKSQDLLLFSTSKIQKIHEVFRVFYEINLACFYYFANSLVLHYEIHYFVTTTSEKNAVTERDGLLWLYSFNAKLSWKRCCWGSGPRFQEMGQDGDYT